MWIPIFLLPNLKINHAVSIDEAAIVPADDPRITAFCGQYPEFAAFIQKFTDPFGVKCAPGILMLDTTSDPIFRSMEAISSFRDLLALSVIPRHRAKSLVNGHSAYIQYSDYFDFYPWSFNQDNGHIVCSTPALSALHLVNDFKGQCSALLTPVDFDSIDLDMPLLKVLLARWQSRYRTKKPAWHDEALFRSLNMAVAASKMPAGVDLTQFDLGRSIALWVSAFEILTHPGTAKGVSLWGVYDLISKAPWREKKTKKALYLPYASKKNRRNLGCWIYGEIHKVRNAFLHGNPVNKKTLTVKGSKRNLFLYAAPLYRMALTGFLPIPDAKSIPGIEWSRERYDIIANQADIEEALSTVRISSRAYAAQKAALLARVKVSWRRGPDQTPETDASSS